MGRPQKKSDIGKPWMQKIQKRRVRNRQPRVRILLICEDAKSAVFYFERIGELLPEGAIFLWPQGTGMNTLSLVNETDNIRRRQEVALGIRFDQVWVLFDKDSFKADEFDNAIRSGEAKGYRVAWSNECFELWYLLHFQEQSFPVGRGKIYGGLEAHLGVNHYRKLKGEAGKVIHRRMAEDAERRKHAIRRARKLDKEARGAFHGRNPVTKVYQLFEALDSWITGN